MSNGLLGDHRRIIAVANQKGGVGKTTTAINLSAALVALGARVLLVDLDPQGNASTGLGVAPADRKLTSYDLLIDEIPVSQVITPTSIEGLWLCPANSDLSSADMSLVSNEKRSFLLHDAIRGPGLDAIVPDFVIIDCPPSLSLLTVREVRQTANPGLRIEGVLLTMADSRNRLSQQVEADARRTLGDLVFKTVIPRNVRVSEAPSFALPVTDYDPTSRGAESYRQLAQEILLRHPLHRNAAAEV